MLELVGFHAAIAQLVERIHGKDEVTSSSLVDGSILGLSANWHVITLAVMVAVAFVLGGLVVRVAVKS